MRTLLFFIVAASLAPTVQAQSPAPTPDHAAEACAVWARETSFAQTVIDHDAAAFSAHLHPGAVFIGGGDSASRGRAAIAADWAGLIEGKQLVLRWYPDVVDVSGDGKTALSRGPYWMDNPAQPADKRYRVGRFISTWVRGRDGKWLVMFDGGGGNVPKPATAAEVEALAAARKACPYR